VFSLRCVWLIESKLFQGMMMCCLLVLDSERVCCSLVLDSVNSTPQ
jgi:hypothetical protein